MHTFDVIIRPIVTEKTTDAADRGRYAFQVQKAANKLQVKEAVERAYKVRVADVNIMNMPAKPRRFGRYPTVKPGWKKAVVTLVEGDRITLFEGV